MIEEKLQNAADALPGPRSEFLAVEERAKKKARRTKSAPRKRFVVAMLLCILLVGCVAVSEPDYHLYNGNWWHSGFGDANGQGWQDTQNAAEKLGITLPETLGGHPVISFSQYNLTNQEVPIWWAWLSPRYVYQSSFYGVEMEEPYISEDGHEGTRHWKEGANVTYGSTDDEIWRRQFGYDENNVYVASNSTLAGLPVEEITSFEYEGFTVYVGRITVSTRELPLWRVTWVDAENGVVFYIDEYYETPDTLIEYAKEIIDLNK